MKILLDENLTHELRPLLMAHHEVFTATYLGWKGLKNGELLAKASAEGFEIMITLDQGIEHSQNRRTLPCAVIIIHATSDRIDDIRPLVPRILIAIHSIEPKEFVHVW